MKQKFCAICQKQLHNMQKQYCSVICKKKKRKIDSEKDIQIETCIFCKKEFSFYFRKGRERKFCNRSCASKFYIKSGKFDAWRLLTQPKKGCYQTCLNPDCCNKVYITPHLQKSNRAGRVCSFYCEKQYFKYKNSGTKNAFYGKKHKKESLIKQKNTLAKNHPGITNAFSLAKRRTKTKPQIEIFKFLKKEFPQFDFQIEKRVSLSNEKEIYADIVSFKKMIVIEFNGDYWHCNPLTYDKDFFHHIKQMKASEIWLHDENRMNSITSVGYNTFVIWEVEYKNDTWKNNLLSWMVKYNEQK